jgi:hypothetical protein
MTKTSSLKTSPTSSTTTDSHQGARPGPTIKVGSGCTSELAVPTAQKTNDLE